MRITMSQLKRLIKEALDEAAVAAPGANAQTNYTQLQSLIDQIDPDFAATGPEDKLKHLKAAKDLLAKLEAQIAKRSASSDAPARGIALPKMESYSRRYRR